MLRSVKCTCFLVATQPLSLMPPLRLPSFFCPTRVSPLRLNLLLRCRCSDLEVNLSPAIFLCFPFPFAGICTFPHGRAHVPQPKSRDRVLRSCSPTPPFIVLTSFVSQFHFRSFVVVLASPAKRDHHPFIFCPTSAS